jgi:hypothetical protein
MFFLSKHFIDLHKGAGEIEAKAIHSRRFTRSPLVGLSFVESRLVYIGDQVKLLGRGFNTNGEFLDLVLLISVGFIVPNRLIRAMTVGIR